MNARAMDELAVFVHGALAFGHALGFLYNVRRRNPYDALAHAAALVYDAIAVGVHLGAIQEEPDGKTASPV